jgi:hypothetical protein
MKDLTKSRNEGRSALGHLIYTMGCLEIALPCTDHIMIKTFRHFNAIRPHILRAEFKHVGLVRNAPEIAVWLQKWTIVAEITNCLDTV